jgi:hypothetical protein
VGKLPQERRGCDHLRPHGILCRHRVRYRIVGPQLVVHLAGRTKYVYEWVVLYNLDLSYCDLHCPAALRAAIEGRVREGGGVRQEEGD